MVSSAPSAEGRIRFQEVSESWGIDFLHRHGGGGEYFMIETMGSGVIVLDYDRDGDDDLLFVDSGELPRSARAVSASRLFRNDGPGRFRDVSAMAGIDGACYGMGGTAADVDGDGDIDLYLTCFGANRLYRNRGDGTFARLADAAGAGDASWGASASFADVDRDGDADLYVANYVDFAFDNNPICGLKSRNLRSYCHPDVYSGLADRFYRNRGDGTFEDQTAAAGFADARGKGLGVLFSDLDGDAWPDLYVANDMTANFLYRNGGRGSFEDTALLSGTAFGESGEPEAGMGVEVGDLDANGYPDILVTHLDQQTTAVYSYTGSGLFVDRRYASRLAEPSFYQVGFGIVLGDFDNDADLDLAIANGHIVHNVEQWGTGSTYRQRNEVFENLGDGRFQSAPSSGLEIVRSSRGAAAADFDLDGRVDLAINNSNDLAEVYRNVSEGGRWLAVAVDSSAGAPVLGARVRLSAGGRRLGRESRAASSYLSQSSATLHFGVGGAETAEELSILWPDGHRRRFLRLPVGRRVRVAR